MVRRSNIKQIFIIIFIICIIHFLIILILGITIKPRLYNQIGELNSTCNLLQIDTYYLIDKDDYGRVLYTTYNISDYNKSSIKKVMVLYIIFHFSEKSPSIRYIPEKYYYLATDSNRESEGFKQFLKDNYWGVKYDDSIKNNYVTNARYIKEYDVGLEERQEIDDKVKSRITDYIIGNDFLAEDDYEFANKIYDRYNKYIYGVFQKSTGNLYGAYVNYEDIEEEIKIVPISYENYREDLNTLKKNVEWYETEAIE